MSVVFDPPLPARWSGAPHDRGVSPRHGLAPLPTLSAPRRGETRYRPPALDRTARRQQLLLTAREVFAKRGYHDTTVDDIVTSAKVARGTFYLYFTDKRTLFEELVDRAFARLGMVIVRVDPAENVEAQVRENIRRIVGALLEDRATTKIMLADAVGVDPAFDRKLLNFYEEVGRLLEDALRDGQSLGVVAPGEPRLYAMLATGALKEILYQVILRGLTYDEAAITNAIFEVFSHGFLRAHVAEAQKSTARIEE